METNNYLTWRQSFLSILSLFTSFGTLVCCALPALLVTLGMGASLISILGIFLITVISEQKENRIYYLWNFSIIRFCESIC